MSDDAFQMNYAEGLNAFQNARRSAFWQEVMSLFRGKSTELLSFDEVKARLRLREESYKGLQNVPLDKIVGSVGRYRDFAANFLPGKTANAERWSRVYAQVSSLQGVPPIELYKVGDVYFVRDGNHRVSVARQLKAETIEAHVTELPTSVKLEIGMSAEDLDAASAYAAFLEESGLSRTRPHHQSLQLSEASRYSDLLGHLYLHHSLEKRTKGPAVSLEEAGADWYDQVYRPAITLIRKYEILEHMPERTETDLYLWMVDHLREMREDASEKVKSRTFSDALVDFLSEQHIPIPKELLLEDDDSVILTRTQVMQAVEQAKPRAESSED